MRYLSFIRKGRKGITPGDPTHNQLVTASKVSAAVIPSRSKYDTYFSLWHKMAGNIPWNVDQDAQVIREGNYLEPVLAKWFATQHPEFNVRDPRSRVWFAPDNTRFGATPDRVIEQGGDVVALLEIKTARNAEGWGREGTDEVPVNYYDQVQWQMYCTGVHRAYIQAQVLGSFREYEIGYNPAHVDTLVYWATRLVKTLKAGEEPDITDAEHLATYDAVRDLHGFDEEHEVELSTGDAVAYLRAKENLAEAKTEYQAAKTELLHSMGDATVALCQGETIATRTQDTRGVISLRHPRRLITSTHLIETTNQFTNNPFRKAA